MNDKKEKDMKLTEEEQTAPGSSSGDDSEEMEDTTVEVQRENSETETIKGEELSEEEKLRKRVTELEDKILRTAAEFENYKKRTIRQYEDMVKFANEKTLNDMLDIIDNFDRALAHKNGDTDLESYAKGIELINSQMHAMLEKYDVKPIESLGKPFDPNLHDAMMQIESDEFEPGHVAMEMNRGYMIGDRVLRHSKVGVAKAKEKMKENEEQDSDS